MIGIIIFSAFPPGYNKIASPQTSFGVRLSRIRDKRTPKDVFGEANNKKAKTDLIRPVHSSSTQALIIDLRWINFRIPCGAFIGLSICLNASMVFWITVIIFKYWVFSHHLVVVFKGQLLSFYFLFENGTRFGLKVNNIMKKFAGLETLFYNF